MLKIEDINNKVIAVNAENWDVFVSSKSINEKILTIVKTARKQDVMTKMIPFTILPP